jgi:two-component system sensor histidine kinase KdpD
VHQQYARTQVWLSARVAQDFLVLTVTDEGPGLPTDAALIRKQAGGLSTGLVFQLCAAVAHAHRYEGREGEARLFNRPEGGACFELWLP